MIGFEKQSMYKPQMNYTIFKSINHKVRQAMNNTDSQNNRESLKQTFDLYTQSLNELSTTKLESVMASEVQVIATDSYTSITPRDVINLFTTMRKEGWASSVLTAFDVLSVTDQEALVCATSDRLDHNGSLMQTVVTAYTLKKIDGQWAIVGLMTTKPSLNSD